MKAILKFESTGKKHNDENGFFSFLVKQEFNHIGSRVIQWCKIEALTVTIEALTPEVVEWGIDTLKNGIKTPTGYEYSLKSVLVLN